MYLFMVEAVVGAQTQVMGLPADEAGVKVNATLAALDFMVIVTRRVK